MRSFRGSYGNRGNEAELRSSDVVPVAGLEPARDRSQGILSPRCLPFHHTGVLSSLTRAAPFVKRAGRKKRQTPERLSFVF